MKGIGNFLGMLGVPALHRMPTARRSFYGVLTTSGLCGTLMPLLSRLADLGQVNVIVAAARQALCVLQRLRPLLFVSVLPSVLGRVPLQAAVGMSQWAGLLCNLYFGFATVLAERPRQLYIKAWLDVARDASRERFGQLLREAGGKKKAVDAHGTPPPPPPLCRSS